MSNVDAISDTYTHSRQDISRNDTPRKQLCLHCCRPLPPIFVHVGRGDDGSRWHYYSAPCHTMGIWTLLVYEPAKSVGPHSRPSRGLVKTVDIYRTLKLKDH
jgi:hypothetical protein